MLIATYCKRVRKLVIPYERHFRGWVREREVLRWMSCMLPALVGSLAQHRVPSIKGYSTEVSKEPQGGTGNCRVWLILRSKQWPASLCWQKTPSSSPRIYKNQFWGLFPPYLPPKAFTFSLNTSAVHTIYQSTNNCLIAGAIALSVKLTRLLLHP